MFPLLHLLAALWGQYLPYTPVWQTEPEKALEPAAPTPRDRWDFAKTPSWSFERTVRGPGGTVMLRDTVFLSWRTEGKVFEEITLGPVGSPSMPGRTLVRAFGVDTLRVKKGLLAPDSLLAWRGFWESVPWDGDDLLEVSRCRDTVGGRNCLEMSSTTWKDGRLSSGVIGIHERMDQAGFLRRRDSFFYWAASVVRPDSFVYDGTVAWFDRDSVRRDADGKPLERIHWGYDWGKDTLIEDLREVYSWSGTRLEKVKKTTAPTELNPSPASSLERVLYWGVGGRLDSVLTTPSDKSCRFLYDAQGRLIGQVFDSLRKRMDLDSQGRLIALRTEFRADSKAGNYLEISLDSFVVDEQGRLAESVHCGDETTRALMNRSHCTRITYAYGIPLPVDLQFRTRLERPVRTRAVVQLRREGSRLVAQGVPGEPLTLRLQRADGRLERSVRGVGGISLELRELPQGLLVWSLESGQRGTSSGRIWLPTR